MEKNIMGDFYMKYIAQYNGKKYDASFQSETEIIIRSNDEMDLKNGFQKYENIFFKIVNKSDLEQLYEEHLYGTYKGIEFSINGETEKTYTIWYWYYDDENINSEIEKCESLGMVLYEKGIYTKSVPMSQITNFRIEKEDLLHQ